MRYQYEIHFNDSIKRNSVTYSYGKIKNICLSIGHQKASIRFQLTSKKAVTELTSFASLLFRDAFRKVYLMHAFQQNQGLVIRKITIVIDGESTVLLNDTPNFPFLFSMIPNHSLNLCDAWCSICPQVLALPKSKMDEDLRFAAVFSYLQSKGRDYEIDRFTNLWTAMNALYTWIAKQYERCFSPSAAVSIFASNDSCSIGALARLIAQQYTQKKRTALDALWRSFYDTEKYLRAHDTPQEIEQLYDVAFNSIHGISPPEDYAPIVACAKRFSVPLFTFLLLTYPYRWRCKLFHGNRTTALLTAYNDYELAVLHTVNYFLDRFLNEEIPKIFDEGYWTTEKQDAIDSYLRTFEPKKYKEACKKRQQFLSTTNKEG